MTDGIEEEQDHDADGDEAAEPDVYDAVMASPRPHATAAAILHLTYARSLAVVGVALMTMYPTREGFLELLSDPEFQEEVGAFADVVDDIRRLQAVIDPSDVEQVAATVEPHYDRACEAVQLTAERLIVDPEDLIAFLVHA